MQRVLIIMLTAFLGILANAQSVPVAILTSGENVTTFYGSSSLKQACETAVDGDIITLSAGVFWSPGHLGKSLTIKGVGMDKDAGEYSRIMGDYLYLDPNEANIITKIENIYFDANIEIQSNRDVELKKCSFYKIAQQNEDCNGKLTITNCIVRGEISIYGPVISTNSFFDFTGWSFNMNVMNDKYPHYFVNCVFRNRIPNSTVENSVFWVSDYNTLLDGSTSASGCKYVGPQDRFFESQTKDNECLPKDTEVFKPDTFYELTDEYAAKWLCKDGSQIGLYGGPEPFSTVPSNPRISKFNVASRTTPDGKLSVDIEVSNPEK